MDYLGKDKSISGINRVDANKFIAKLKGNILFLNGITDLSPESTKILIKWQGSKYSFYFL